MKFHGFITLLCFFFHTHAMHALVLIGERICFTILEYNSEHNVNLTLTPRKKKQRQSNKSDIRIKHISSVRQNWFDWHCCEHFDTNTFTLPKR